MLFNSLHFLFFFVFITLLYFTVPKRTQWVLLLLASCYFYAAFIPAYLIILFIVILIDYVAGIWIERTAGSTRKVLLIASLVSNIGILAFFKYYNFFNDNLTALLSLTGVPNALPPLQVLLPGIVLPIGLSFHTFQSMSYTIEVYRGNYPAERHLGIYSLYVLFYPQLVAGPIERPQNILPQLHRTYSFDWARVRSGLMMMGWGMVKKVVIADRLALVVDPAYADVQAATGATLWLAVFFYAIQIYCDFSGYSDIALGAGKVMGIKMMENFETPYLSQSISEFWRRWHISLSTWFRDYLYIPLGGNRKGEMRQYLNMLVVFLASGLWHGPNWTYVIWGGLNGVYQILAVLRDKLVSRMGFPRTPPRQITSPVHDRESRQSPGRVVLNTLITFVLIMLTWVFFRARDLSDAFLILKRIGTLSFGDQINSPMNGTEMLFSIFLIGFLLLKEHFYLTIPTRSNVRFAVLFGLITFATYLFGVFSSNQFIYFQF